MYSVYNRIVSQINLHTTPGFERALAKLMKLRGLKSKSEAIRAAVEEAAQRAARKPSADFREWIGLGKAGPDAPPPRFASDDDLWR